MPADASRDGAEDGSHEGLVLMGLFMAALALRPQLVGAGPLIPAIQADLGVAHAVVGLVGTIPVLCMGLFAPVAPILAARVGTRNAIAVSLGLIGLCGLGRVVAADAWQLAAQTVGVGIGMGLAGALLPVFVKERLATRPVAGTVAYSSGLQLGSAASAAAAVPIALIADGWRGALAVFSGATIGVTLLWIVLAGRRATQVPRIAVSRMAFGDRRGWELAAVFAAFGVVYYGIVSWLVDAYVEAGWTAGSAGTMLGVLNLAALAGALSIGLISGRLLPYRVTLALYASGFALGTIGFATLPAAGIVWAILVGYTNGSLFPLILVLPLRLVVTPDRVAGLSAVMLGVGYTIAAVSPVGLGAVRDATGSFRASLGVLGVIAVLFAVGTSLVARKMEHSPSRG